MRPLFLWEIWLHLHLLPTPNSERPFFDGGGCGGAINHALLHCLLFPGVEVVLVKIVKRKQGLLASLAQLFFRQTTFQPFSSPAEGLIDSFRGRCQTALEDGKGEPNGCLAFAVQLIGTVELFLNIFCDSGVKCGFHCRKVVTINEQIRQSAQ